MRWHALACMAGSVLKAVIVWTRAGPKPRWEANALNTARCWGPYLSERSSQEMSWTAFIACIATSVLAGPNWISMRT